ncbi:MAG: ribose-5-phosphate isomerase [Brevibacterium aurantiacum]|uniref:Ribose-5-phosphate isomerase B n=3 Tax=Brevibacterium TaxID=1696 RepID=A0A1D7W3F4_BREAU|nr:MULTISPECIES: ribose-5-phosphate isomerase [Brevibacterium]AOP53495.1 Ribose 5-phosphate isomerase B [Brevibacterium aurantiacum]AZL05686.1 ribose-5-phosphate isomerase [Brevibacterium aurantiacum]AZL09274.1 ribose-5-phosphate isomerase [Brevibacterium aurantiacum]AZL12896.1 ribose-5-phosphate isomerase [Brevibacterium aurantiacum]AZT93363.1 ribose-5-phosphate isomerase [Brevibacterium aurantiacum]
MKVHLGTDHAGFEFKETLKAHLGDSGFEVVDHGAHEYDALDDYPAFCIAAAQAVVDDQAAGVEALGVVIGGSGNGEQIAANKVKGARTALAWNTDIAKLAREHNNAQIVSVGARQHTEAESIAIVDAFLAEPFSGEERHERRIRIMDAYEAEGPSAL